MEQLSGVGAAVIKDVKMLSQQFRQREVEMEKKNRNVKETSNREK